MSFPATDNNLKLLALTTLKLKLGLYLKRLKLFLNLTPMRLFGKGWDEVEMQIMSIPQTHVIYYHQQESPLFLLLFLFVLKMMRFLQAV